MNAGEVPARFRDGAHIAVLGALLLTLCCSSANAEPPPRDGCRAASRIEYDSAKREHLLRSRFGTYVRTGHLWRHYYWYCHL
jgi:hypothetical protein